MSDVFVDAISIACAIGEVCRNPVRIALGVTCRSIRIVDLDCNAQFIIIRTYVPAVLLVRGWGRFIYKGICDPPF